MDFVTNAMETIIFIALNKHERQFRKAIGHLTKFGLKWKNIR